MIGHRQRVAVLLIAQQELSLVVGAPELVGPLSRRERRALSATPDPATTLDQPVAVEYGMDGAFGGNGDIGEPADQLLADLARAPLECSCFTFRM